MSVFSRVQSAVRETGGFDIPGSGLAKFQIEYETGIGNSPGVISAHFNPQELVFTKQANWEERREITSPDESKLSRQINQSFLKNEPETLSVTLFFDTYEGARGNIKHKDVRSLDSAATFAKSKVMRVSVGDLTNKVASLMKVNVTLHRPPVCTLLWGQFAKEYLFKGVLTNLSRTFTMFRPNGMPVRATLECTFVEYAADVYGNEEDDETGTIYRVRNSRENLETIAASELGNPNRWKEIVTANPGISFKPPLNTLVKIP